MNDLVSIARLTELINKERDDREKKILWAVAIVAAVCIVAVAVLAVYKFLAPDEDEYADEFEDEFEDDFFDDEDDEEL